jgi:hypothetical protein
MKCVGMECMDNAMRGRRLPMFQQPRMWLNNNYKTVYIIQPRSGVWAHLLINSMGCHPWPFTFNGFHPLAVH